MTAPDPGRDDGATPGSGPDDRTTPHTDPDDDTAPATSRDGNTPPRSGPDGSTTPGSGPDGSGAARTGPSDGTPHRTGPDDGTAPRSGPDDVMEPARGALLQAARADAEARIADARQEADRALGAAAAEAADITERARRQGAADGAADFAEQVGDARREAAAARLAALGAIHAELVRRVTERVGELYAADPSAGDQLAARARALLGPDARTSPHPAGGVLATAPGRRVDLGVPALAARVLESCGARVEALWTR